MAAQPERKGGNRLFRRRLKMNSILPVKCGQHRTEQPRQCWPYLLLTVGLPFPSGLTVPAPPTAMQAVELPPTHAIIICSIAPNHDRTAQMLWRLSHPHYTQGRVRSAALRGQFAFHDALLLCLRRIAAVKQR